MAIFPVQICDAEVAPLPPVAGLTQGQQQQAGRRCKNEKLGGRPAGLWTQRLGKSGAPFTNESAYLLSCRLWPRALTAAVEAALTAGGYKDTAK